MLQWARQNNVQAFRLWWDQAAEVWYADVRFGNGYMESSVVQRAEPEDAVAEAIRRAAVKAVIEGVPKWIR